MYRIEALKYANVSMQFCDTAYITVHSGMVKWTSGLQAAEARIGFAAWKESMQLHSEETINNI